MKFNFFLTILFYITINNITYLNGAFSCVEKLDIDFKLCSTAADILLIIDTSNKMSHNEFDNMKSRLIELIDMLDIDVNKINIGILSYGDRIKQLHHITSSKFEKQIIKNKINDLEQAKDAGLTTKTLNFAKLIFQLSQRSINIPKIAILYSTGFYRDNEIISIRREVNQLKIVSHLITVDVLGNGLSNRNLRMIASCPNYYVRFDNLLNLVKTLSNKSCLSFLKFIKLKNKKVIF